MDLPNLDLKRREEIFIFEGKMAVSDEAAFFIIKGSLKLLNINNLKLLNLSFVFASFYFKCPEKNSSIVVRDVSECICSPFSRDALVAIAALVRILISYWEIAFCRVL
ncbi:hypothetical protein SAMN05444407_102153 [Chryseobacterium contaminans]|uniref:Uncharacterized protein n=1 Tax=Chryseobacterium contaminans TaxID=1423959 RepID=A0A1M6XNY2_9FLAO|nr:hypothetical protein SAMN05444407_102153 [Chryseobacterium contaminans]